MSAVREAIEAVVKSGSSSISPGSAYYVSERALVDALVAAVEAVRVVSPIEGNGSMDGVTPILFFEAGSEAMRELRAALTWSNVTEARITIDDGYLKWKVGAGTWCSGYPTERPNGGNG